MLLNEIIQQRIVEEGPISFHDFMEMALYYPNLGYYTSTKDKIGTKGDFYTSSSLTPAFGAMIGKQLEQMWILLDKKPFTIVEYGAGTGRLCNDILDYLKNNAEMYANLRYCIIEKSPAMQIIEKIHSQEKISWYNSIQEIQEINGCILSNELLDNFSVHQVLMETELMEIYVDYKEEFIEILKPAPKILVDYLAELNVKLPTGFRTEINIEATQWIKDIATSLQKGYVLTIDYGSFSPELYSNRKCCGTLICYNKHSINSDYYNNIGQQDITSHVNFSALNHWGSKNGLDCYGYTDQAHFLLALGFKEYLNKLDTNNNDILQLALKNASITHLLLMDMGSKYKVLIQQKGIPKYKLVGLNHT